MGKIIRWYNQNRMMFWTVILVIIGIISLIQILDNYYVHKQKNEDISNTYTKKDKSNYSIVTQEKIDENVSNESLNIIKTFFDYCNSENIEEAYNLISSDCKNELYPTVDKFKQEYYDRIFTEKRSYNADLWMTTAKESIYRIQIMSDLLATGQKEYMPIEDYYTIIYEYGQYKLSISNYIRKENINAFISRDNITVRVISKKIYMDYEIYEIEITNQTGKKMVFNTKEKVDSMYIQDENDLKFIAFLNEIPNSELEIQNGMTKTLNIKFNREYKPRIHIKKIVFENIRISNGNNQIIKIEIEL